MTNIIILMLEILMILTDSKETELILFILLINIEKKYANKKNKD